MLLPIIEDQRTAESDAIIKTISSRVAGGRRALNLVPSQVCLCPLSPPLNILSQSSIGHCGHAGVPLNVTFFAACLTSIGHTGDIDGRRLYLDSRDMRREEEFIGFGFELQ